MKQSTFLFLAAFIIITISSCQTRPIMVPTLKPVDKSTPIGDTSKDVNKNSLLNLSINELDSMPPPDVLEEIDYYGGMGGGLYFCDKDFYDEPEFIPGLNDENPELTQLITIHICGLPVAGEDVRIRVDLPDGTIKNYNQITESSRQSYAELYFSYVPEFEDPVGTYHFVFAGSNWSLDRNLPIYKISRSSLIAELEANNLILTNFEPNEQIRLFIYHNETGTEIAKLIGWKYLQVDNKGQLIVHTDFPVDAHVYVAIGNSTGQVGYVVKGYRTEWKGGDITK